MAEKWWDKVPEDLANWFRIGDRLERALREEEREKLRLLNIWARQGRNIPLGIQLGLINDPNEEQKLRQRLIELEKEENLLSRGTPTELQNKAWEDALKTVLDREGFSAETKKSAIAQLGKLQSDRMGTITQFAKFNDKGKTEAGKVLSKLTEGMEEWKKSKAGLEWAAKPENRGKPLLYLDNPVAKEKVAAAVEAESSALLNQLGGLPTKTGASGKPIIDQSKLTSGQAAQFAKLVALDESLRGTSGVGLVEWTSHKPKLNVDTRVALNVAEQLTGGEQLMEQEDLLTQTRKILPGVKNSDRISRDVINVYRRYLDAQEQAIKAGVNPQELDSIRDLKFKTQFELNLLSPQLKKMLLRNPVGAKVAQRLNVDLTTPQGGKEVIKFGAQNGFRYWKKKQQGGAREATKSLRRGDFGEDWASDFYVKKVSPTTDSLPTREEESGEPAVASPEFVEPGPTGVPDVVPEDPSAVAAEEPTEEPAVAAAKAALAPEPPPEEVDLLADEEEEVVIPEASDLEAAQERAAFDQQQELKAAEKGEFEDLVSQVSETQDVPLPDPDRPLADAFGTVEPRAPGSSPELVQSFQAGRPRGKGALERALYEQQRQKILGASRQMAKTPPAETMGSVADLSTMGVPMAAPIKAATAAAYRAAFDAIQRQMRSGSDPQAEAQRIAAEKLKEAEGI